MSFSKITVDGIRRISDYSTFSKGEDYYRKKAVKKLVFNPQDDAIIAAVKGRALYEAGIHDVSGEPVFTCDCPMGGYGMCKHRVAAALAVVLEPHSVTVAEPPGKNEECSEESIVDIGDVFKKAGDRQKEEFLLRILRENEAYRERFRTLVLGPLLVESGRSVEELRDDVAADIENFDLDDYERFYDNGAQRHGYGYRDESEILYDGASEEVNELFESYTGDIDACLKAGNIVDAAKQVLGLYEGILTAKEPEDEVGIFYAGVRSEIMGLFIYYFPEFIKRFFALERDEEPLMRISQLFVRRLDNYRGSGEEISTVRSIFGGDDEGEYAGYEYYLAGLKVFLTALIATPDLAAYWDKQLERLELKNSITDTVQLKIHQFQGYDDDWEAGAKAYYRENPDITRELLDYYKKKNDTAGFREVGRYALANWGRSFDSYLYENLAPADEPELFGEALLHLSLRDESVPLYREYKSHFGEQEALRFVRKLGEDWSKRNFYVALQEEEKDFSAILEFVRNNSSDRDFSKHIRPILNVYPAECFKIIRKKTDAHLERNVGRKYYREAVGWLTLLLEIEDDRVEEDVQRYFNSLFQLYNCRPALKDELRKAGIEPG